MNLNSNKYVTINMYIFNLEAGVYNFVINRSNPLYGL